MKITESAYRLRVLFEEKIMSYYRNTFRGSYGIVQTEVLEHLSEYKIGKTQQIADALWIPKQHASLILKKLESDGMVRQDPDPSDRRSVLYSLTEKGAGFMQEHQDISNRHFEDKYLALATEEQEKMKNAMETLVELLEKF